MATPFDATTWLLQTFLILVGLLAALPLLRATLGLLLVLGSRAAGREGGKAHALGLRLLPKFARILLSAGMGLGAITTLAPAQAAPTTQPQSSQAVNNDEQLLLDRMVAFRQPHSVLEPAEIEPLPQPLPSAASARKYRVAPGDSLWSIAQAALSVEGQKPSNQAIDSAWRRIWQLNFDEVGGNPSLILPGQVLRIPDFRSVGDEHEQ